MAAFALQAKTVDELRFYINPGHGSWGPNDRPMATIPYPNNPSTGRPDTCGFYESNTNLWKCLRLREELIKMGVKDENVTMSRVKNGPYPYVSGAADAEIYNRSLAEICEEVEAGNYDMFISIHSNAATDGTTTNYPLYLYRGYDAGQTGGAGYTGPGVVGSDQMALVNWPYHHLNLDFEPQNYYQTSTNVRGDINFYGSYSTRTDPNSGQSYAGYLGVLKHGVPGFLLEGYFHTYQPARHRALNPDYDYLEGIHVGRGVAAYFGFDMTGKGAIIGTVKDAHEKIVNNLFKYAPKTNDQWLPLNGATVKLLKDGAEVASYPVDNNYNGLFAFFDLEPGKYKLSASLEGYKAQGEFTPNSISTDMANLINLSLGEFTVNANETTYPLLYLESETFVPEAVDYKNYPDPVQPPYLKLASEYNFTQDEGTTYSEITGKIVQTLQYGDSTIVLTHIDKTANIFIVDNNTKKVVKEVNTDGLFSMEDNLGFYNEIGSIALSADGKLVGVTAVRNSYSDSHVVLNGNNGAGYKRGTMHAYYWNDFDAAPTDWFSTQYSANWYNADMGLGVAVSGPINECTVCVPAPTTSTARGIRVAFFSIADGAVVSTYRANSNNDINLNMYGDILNIDGQHDGLIKVAVSPFDDNAFVIGGSQGNITEFPTSADGAAPAWYHNFPAGEEVLANGIQFFKYAGRVLMVAPYGTTGNVKGIKLFELTDGINNARLIATTNTDIVNTASGAPALKDITVGDAAFAWAGAKVLQENITAYLVSNDNNIVKFSTADAEQDLVKGIYAFDLNDAEGSEEYTFTFSSNDDAVSAKLIFTDANTGEVLGEVDVPNVKKGENQITLTYDQLPGEVNQEMNWAVNVAGKAIPTIARLNEYTSDFTYTSRTSNVVDKSPESDFFGRIYVMNRVSQPNVNNGLYVYDPLWNRLNSKPLKGGYADDKVKFSGPFRLGIDSEGYVYCPDWADGYSGVYVLNPNDLEGDIPQFFMGTRQSSGLFVNNGVNVGGSSPGVAVSGTGADTKLYVYDEDYPTGNGVSVFNIGQPDGSIVRTWGEAPSARFEIGYLQVNTNGNVVPDGKGGVWVAQTRSAGNNNAGVPSLIHVSADGNVDLNSGREPYSDWLDGSNGSGFAISNDGKTLVINDGSNLLQFFDLTWDDEDVPALTPKYSFAADCLDGSNLYQMHFDYAGNLVATGNKLAIYSMPTDDNQATTPAKKSLIVVKREVTAVNDVDAAKTVANVRYVNVAGMVSDKPFEGVNIVVTTYTDGTSKSVKVVK